MDGIGEYLAVYQKRQWHEHDERAQTQKVEMRLKKKRKKEEKEGERRGREESMRWVLYMGRGEAKVPGKWWAGRC